MVVGIIPARYSSTRFPGKPLCDIAGKPMIYHTYFSAKKSNLVDRLIVATDDYRIVEKCVQFGMEYVLTPDNIQTGSDRIAFVAKEIVGAKIIVNIQGDEPFIPSQMIDEAIEPLIYDSKIEVSTLIKKITDVEDIKSASVVKVVFDQHNFALYFSRSPIPFVRDSTSFNESLKLNCYYKHIGLYVFRTDALFKFTRLPQTDLERFEKLEQLRMLEHGMKIKVVETELDSLSIDTPDDLKKALIHYSSILS